MHFNTHGSSVHKFIEYLGLLSYSKKSEQKKCVEACDFPHGLHGGIMLFLPSIYSA